MIEVKAMDPGVFENLFTPVQAKWQTTFTNEVREQVYHLVKFAPQQAFKELCGKLIWKKGWEPPTVEDFAKFGKEHSKAKQITAKWCPLCGGSGYVRARNLQDDRYTSFRCTNCFLGRSIQPEVKLNGRTMWLVAWSDVSETGEWSIDKPFNPADRNLQVFTPAECAEIFKFMRDTVNGKHSRDEVKHYCSMLQNAIDATRQQQAQLPGL